MAVLSDEKKYVKECEQLKKELSNEGIKEYYEKYNNYVKQYNDNNRKKDLMKNILRKIN